jgi:hypothetical protein
VTDDGADTAPLQPMMPPRRGWGIFGLGFYKDGAPTALGNCLGTKRFILRSKTKLRQCLLTWDSDLFESEFLLALESGL